MSCETDLAGINSNTGDALTKLDSVISAVNSISISGADMSTTEDYLHDLVLLMASMHQNVLGTLPDGLVTVGGV